MTNFATAEAAFFFSEVGLFFWSELARESVGIAAMIKAIPKMYKVVHLSAKIENSNMKVVDVHSIGVVLGEVEELEGAGGPLEKRIKWIIVA
jgi:hypothetical protein